MRCECKKLNVKPLDKHPPLPYIITLKKINAPLSNNSNAILFCEAKVVCISAQYCKKYTTACSVPFVTEW